MASHVIKNCLFKLMIYEKDGQSFQDFFVKIMKKIEPSFLAIKPQGSFGDKKNDGYIPSNGAYFQVYAPENLQQPSTSKKMENKLEEDFCGLYDAWNSINPVKCYRFVVNDKFKGIPVNCALKMDDLRRRYPQVYPFTKIISNTPKKLGVNGHIRSSTFGRQFR